MCVKKVIFFLVLKKKMKMNEHVTDLNIAERISESLQQLCLLFVLHTNKTGTKLA